jgi:hypothetical protein
MRVELTPGGDLILAAEVAQRCFGEAPSALVAVRGEELWAVALGPGAVGGLLLKRRNRAGDRSMLVIEALRETNWEAGEREARWDEGERALRVPLSGSG